MSGAHDWPLLYSVPRWRQEEEASAPSLLWQEDLLKKKLENLRKIFRQIVMVSGITLSTGKYSRMLSRIVNLLENLDVLPCLVRSLPPGYWYITQI